MAATVFVLLVFRAMARFGVARISFIAKKFEEIGPSSQDTQTPKEGLEGRGLFVSFKLVFFQQSENFMPGSIK